MSQEMQVQITRGYHFALIMVTEFRSLIIPSAGKNVLLLGEEGVEVDTPRYWATWPHVEQCCGACLCRAPLQGMSHRDPHTG